MPELTAVFALGVLSALFGFLLGAWFSSRGEAQHAVEVEAVDEEHSTITAGKLSDLKRGDKVSFDPWPVAAKMQRCDRCGGSAGFGVVRGKYGPRLCVECDRKSRRRGWRE